MKDSLLASLPKGCPSPTVTESPKGYTKLTWQKDEDNAVSFFAYPNGQARYESQWGNETENASFTHDETVPAIVITHIQRILPFEIPAEKEA